MVHAGLLQDGRQRAQLFGDSSKGGAWVDRVKIPGGKRVLAHTHPQDELVTVIEGTLPQYPGGDTWQTFGRLRVKLNQSIQRERDFSSR